MIFFPPEWIQQSFVQLTWPHAQTDWSEMLDEVDHCFISIATAITRYENLLIVTPEPERVRQLLTDLPVDRIVYAELPTNDTWARDHGAITVFDDGKPTLLDFTFNGWGMKFAANHDNQITSQLYKRGYFPNNVQITDCQSFVLEGGSLETDGEGTLLTTEECLLSINRNSYLNKGEIEAKLSNLLGIDSFLWLTSGYLAGDDTDSHIDTLARFCSPDTIAYVKCEEVDDEHYVALRTMERELYSFRRKDGTPYRLISLPMADRVDFEGERLPATYANFLIINGAVLVPIYQSAKDELALSQIRRAFPDREVIGIDCTALIKQHGSLHCVTMQYPDFIIFATK